MENLRAERDESAKDTPIARQAAKGYSNTWLLVNGVLCLAALVIAGTLAAPFILDPIHSVPMVFVVPVTFIALAIGVGRALAIADAVLGISSRRRWFRYLRPVMALIFGFIVAYEVGLIGIRRGEAIVESQFAAFVQHIVSVQRSTGKAPADISDHVELIPKLPKGNDGFTYYHSDKGFGLLTQGPRLATLGTLMYYYGPNKEWNVIDFDDRNASSQYPQYKEITSWSCQAYEWDTIKNQWTATR